MKGKIALHVFSFFLVGLMFAANSATAQTIAYRQTNLASNVSGFANQTNQLLRNPWGISLLLGQSFSIANTNNGRLTTHDATGSSTGPAAIIVPSPASTGPGAPTGIVADSNSFFGGGNLVQPLITATEDGGIYIWGVDQNGNFLEHATLVVDHSQAGAVYTGVAILTPNCCVPFLAVANFHSGRVETYSTQFAPLGSFLDPSLPAGYAPFGMQVVGNQLFITSALQDAAKHDPVFGAGNGIVSVFNLEGHFLRQFATAGPLNAPWGITQASANFGPFSNDILIGDLGDGTINAFDPSTGDFVGKIKDGHDNLIVNAGLHALAFRSNGFGGPDTLYFTAGINNGLDGLFGAITIGLVSTTKVSVPSTPTNIPVAITVTVSAGPGNLGTPTGQVSLNDGGVSISDVSLTDGMIRFPETLTGIGKHVIEAKYGGDATFLPSSSQTEVQITGTATILTLVAPGNAAPGSPVILTATISPADGTPTGQIVFHDGITDLGTAQLDAAGVASLTINTLAVGTHTLTAFYSGDANFDGSTSAAIITTIANSDFTLGAAPPTATVSAGQSVLFNIAVTPAGAFADPVTFSCPVLTGIVCNFNPPMVTPNGGVVTTMLTVTTSANVARYGQTLSMTGFGLCLASLGLISILASLKKRMHRPYAAFLKVTASALSVIALALTLVSCGGYTTNGQTGRGTASIVVTARSTSISHTTNVSVTVQ
jgi:uncharacterized protein (TIGR03118 family)